MKRLDYESPTLEVVRISCSGMVATSPGDVQIDFDEQPGFSEDGGHTWYKPGVDSDGPDDID